MKKHTTQAKYEAKIRKSLTAAARYSPAMDIQITTLASTLITLDTVTADIAALDDYSRWCGDTLKAHPAFAVQRYAWDSVTRQVKALGLSFADLGNEVQEDDPLIGLTQDLIDISRSNAATLRPE